VKLPKKVTPIFKKAEVVEKPKYTDLRQVMDYTRPLNIFFSGVEYESYLEILYNLGIRNFLMSYEYLRGKGISQLKKYPDMHLFIDSGAFTYINDPKYEEYTVEQWENQIEKYLNWAEKHKDQIFAIADLDLQYVVGCEQVYEWRKKYFEPFMLRTGIPVCFMYHDEGMSQWEYMCKRYPYVGLSLVVDNGNDVKEMFRIAEKHNTLIQGMASTNTQMLVNYPFYTVDSTTWNVGLKYGEISVWNGSKMSRIKKQDFQSKGFPIIQRYDRDFDFDLILEEDKTEMIKVNAYAFVMAEKYIRERLKSKMYWFKAKAQKVDLNNLPEDFYPTQEMINDRTLTLPQAQEYAKKMNINPEYEGVLNLVCDLTTFMNWDNPDYAELVEWYKDPEQEKLIQELHDIYVNRIVESKEDMYSDLTKFFTECVSGENDKLLQLGTNFDRIVKEREHYIEEEETEVVELTEAQVRDRISYLLPTPADEVDEVALAKVDKEIYSHLDIKPQFDEKGKFLKGQTIARKPKKVYSDKYPKLACDTCLNAAKCPEYKAGYVCAFNKMFKRFDTRNMTDIMEGMQSIVGYNMERMQRAMINETLNGVIDPTTTSLMDQNIRYMNMLKQMYENSSAEVLRQSRVIRNDGTLEETTQVVNPQSGGILEKIFGGMNEPPKKKTEEEKIIIEENKE
jgi:hypothetical protein